MDKELIVRLYRHFLSHPSVTTDSRAVSQGQLFFALVGERFDGNAYAAAAIQQGAALAVVSDAQVAENLGEKAFLVPDTLKALQDLAAFHRMKMRTWERPVTVIGITGTNGKTTTKELTRAVLSQRYHTLATEGNLNNQIGVPLTLLRITEGIEMAIIEMGANHPGDIYELAAIVRPDYGLITNVGKAHLQGFGSLQGVLTAKGALYEQLKADEGIAFINSFDGMLLQKALTTGVSCRPYLPASLEACDPLLSFSLYDTDDDTPALIHTHLIGAYNMINCQAAATVGRYFDVPVADVVKALEGYTPQNMRSQLLSLGARGQIVLDAYNANVSSMTAALDSFTQAGYPHRSVILGDMLELGEASLAEHVGILNQLFTHTEGLDYVLLVGEQFCEAFRTQVAENTAAAAVTVLGYLTVDDLLADTHTLTLLGGTILIKGSRGIHLEKAAQALQDLSQLP